RLVPAGWRVLTYCWIAFALSLAGFNELIWRTVDTDTWVTIKTVVGPASIIGYIAITRALAPIWWDMRYEDPRSA
nr:septation protein IspZ [Alphaproteobacteria bacterium]